MKNKHCWSNSYSSGSNRSSCDQIIKQAEDYDLVVMGTMGKSGLSHLLMGSVAEKVVRHSPVPVLVLPLKIKGKD